MTRRWLLLAALTVTAGPLLSSARATQLDLAATPAVKLAVRGAGWMRVAQPALLAAGLDPRVDPGQLRLYADGIEQSIRITGNGDSTFDSDEAVEFYGVGRDTLWTDTRTYWLVAGGVGSNAATAKRVPLEANPRGSGSGASFPSVVLSQPRKIYYAPVLNGDATNFFGDVVQNTGATEILAVPHLDPTEPATLQVVLQGVTTGTHQVAVSLNGLALGTCTFAGQNRQPCPFAAPAVGEGNNQVTLVAGGDAPDVSLVDTVEIDYAHLYTADGDALDLTVPPATRIAIGGFTSADVRVVDVTDPDSPVELVTGLSFDGASYVVGVSTPGDTADHALLAFTDAAVGAPSGVAASRPSAWATSPGAEMVILSNAAFVDAVRPLATRRAQQGWSVDLIDLQDVYDELGGGDESVFAIRDFLQYAHAHWSTPPRFVLLVGDASFDPRNFLGMGDFDFAPTKLIDTAEMETASDDWFVDWNSDGVPDIAIGRWSVRTAAEATTVVGKTLDYQGIADLPQGGLFVADQSDGGLDFEGTSRTNEADVSAIMPIESFFLSQATSTPTALYAKLNQGPFLVNYMGHGSVEVWDGLFSDTDATALTNPRLSIYVSMNCLNGFFHDVYTESLAESLMKAPSGGAVAVWASSTLSSFAPQAVLDRELLKRLTHTSLGEAAMAAKAAITDYDAQRTWILFGDPTLFGTPGSKGGGLPPPADAGTDAGPPDARDGGGGRRDAGAGDAQIGDDAGGDDAGNDAGHGTGPDAHPRLDGGPDGARPDASASGCGCRLDPSPTPREVVPIGLGLLALALGRRRRGPAQASDGER
jgi:MYXO-CTERM domain-containing protein